MRFSLMEMGGGDKENVGIKEEIIYSEYVKTLYNMYLYIFYIFFWPMAKTLNVFFHILIVTFLCLLFSVL
jgi:hypothetical protein